MAAIFFEGFNANRPRNDAYYGVRQSDFSSNYPASVIFGSTEKKRNPGTPNAGALKLTAIGKSNYLGSPGVQNSFSNGPNLQCTFATQTGKKLFFGVAISGLQLHPYNGQYTDGQYMGSGTPPESYLAQPPLLEHTFLRLKSSTGQNIDLTVLAGGTTTVPMKLLVSRSTADTETFDILSDYIGGGLQAEGATFPWLGSTVAQFFEVVRDPSNNDFIYFEFAVDLTDPLTTTFECRINDQPLRLTSAPETEVLSLSSPMPNINRIIFFSGVSGDMFYDDFYVADDTGITVNDFLGRETAVYSPNLTAATEIDWDVVSSLTPADPTLNIIDDANYITTGGFDQVSTFNGTISPGATALVGAVMLTSYAKKVSLDAKYEHVYKPAVGNVQAIGAPRNVTNLSFNCPENTLCAVPLVTIMPVNPVTNAQWTVSEINSDSFGVKSLDPAV